MNAQSSILDRVIAPLDALRSLRGLTVTDELRILFALAIGYCAISVSKVLRPARASIERRFGAYRIDFIAKLTNLKYLISRSSDGFCFVMRPNWCDYEISSSFFEPEVKQVFKPKMGEVVIDVGAHIGLYTVRSARAVGKGGLVIALEPDPETFALLNLNVNLNKSGDVVTLRRAAYESDGTSILHRSVGSGGHSLVRVSEETTGEIEVPTITLDTLARMFDLDRVDWVKIDVEGAELAVLKGANNALRMVKSLIVEVWSENANEVFSILERRGYRITVLTRAEHFMYILAQR